MVKVVKSIYGASGLIGKRLSNNVSNSPWISILKAVRKLDNDVIHLFSLCKKKVGDEKSTLFGMIFGWEIPLLKCNFQGYMQLRLTNRHWFMIDWSWCIETWFNVDYREGSGGITDVGSTGDSSYGHYI